jgi:uncharacterized protein YxeA
MLLIFFGWLNGAIEESMRGHTFYHIANSIYMNMFWLISGVLLLYNFIVHIGMDKLYIEIYDDKIVVPHVKFFSKKVDKIEIKYIEITKIKENGTHGKYDYNFDIYYEEDNFYNINSNSFLGIETYNKILKEVVSNSPSAELDIDWSVNNFS